MRILWHIIAWEGHVICELAWYGIVRKRNNFYELACHGITSERHCMCELAWHFIGRERYEHGMVCVY